MRFSLVFTIFLYCKAYSIEWAVKVNQFWFRTSPSTPLMVLKHPPPISKQKASAKRAARSFNDFLYRNVFEYLIDKLPHAMDKGKAI